jgi:YVTN family beta-propeller protein
VAFAPDGRHAYITNHDANTVTVVDTEPADSAAVIPARFGTHTRYRRHLPRARTAEKARLEKLLEDAQPKSG